MIAMTSKFTDCVWYSNGMRAGQRAEQLCFKAAEPMYVVHDKRTGMFGVGTGDSEPAWCREARGFELLRIVRPRVS